MLVPAIPVHSLRLWHVLVEQPRSPYHVAVRGRLNLLLARSPAGNLQLVTTRRESLTDVTLALVPNVEGPAIGNLTADISAGVSVTVNPSPLSSTNQWIHWLLSARGHLLWKKSQFNLVRHVHI
jgi:hypothetical protein